MDTRGGAADASQLWNTAGNGGWGLFSAVLADDVGTATAQILSFGFTVDLSRPKFDQASCFFVFVFFYFQKKKDETDALMK